MHVFDGGQSNGAKLVVCQVCHAEGLTAAEASKLSGIKQSGVFKYHWRTGQRSLTEHVEKRHGDLLDAIKAEKAAKISGATAPDATAVTATAAAASTVAARAGVKRPRGDADASPSRPPVDAPFATAAASAAAALRRRGQSQHRRGRSQHRRGRSLRGWRLPRRCSRRGPPIGHGDEADGAHAKGDGGG